jgi:hypothetical protein
MNIFDIKPAEPSVTLEEAEQVILDIYEMDLHSVPVEVMSIQLGIEITEEDRMLAVKAFEAPLYFQHKLNTKEISND